MTPGARIAAAIELLEDLETAAAPPGLVIGRYFRRRRFAGSKDRRAISGHVFDVLRRRARLDWHIDRAALGGRPTPRLRVIANLALDGVARGEIENLFNGAGHAPKPLENAEHDLAGLSAPLSHPDMPPWVAGEYPQWLEDGLERAFGESLAGEMAAFNAEAPLDVRVNSLRGGRDGAVAALAADGIEAAPTPLSPVGLRIRGRTRLRGAGAYRDGLVEVQDEGSQLVALLAGARPGMAVADFCAGAGGKALALAAEMENTGSVAALDTDADRLARMGERLRRAGADIVTAQVLEKDGAGAVAPARGAAPAGGFDRVLVDAPCTGIGAWRRGPLARWRLGPEDLAGFIAAQENILPRAAALVAPGGRLIYATCSPLAQENEDRVAAFLGKIPGFRVVPAGDVWEERLDAPFPGPGPYLRLTPAATGTDGFFAAILERAA